MADAAPAVLITGATSGLGLYLARELASSGWQVLARRETGTAVMSTYLLSLLGLER